MQNSSSSKRSSVAMRSGLCAGRSPPSTANFANHVFMELALGEGALSCWNIDMLGLLVPVKRNLQHTESVWTLCVTNFVATDWGRPK